MYFTGKITIDPSELTKIEKVKPKKAFKKFMFHLTSGLVHDKEEHETFTAISVLQQLNTALLDVRIDNIVRLSHDDIHIYVDNEGKKGDLKEAFDKYDLTINDAMSTVFEQLSMVLEHQVGSFYYLIEIDINRTHEVAEYPIVMRINGLLKDFKSGSFSSSEKMREKMKSVFTSQESYDTFIREKESEFEAFIGTIEMSIKKFLKVDDVKSEVTKKLIAPNEKLTGREQFKVKSNVSEKRYYDHDPVYYNYYGVSDFLFYSWLWSDMMHDNHIQVQDVQIMNNEGEVLGSIGDEALDSADLSVLDENTSYEDSMADTPSEFNVEHADFSNSDSLSDSSSGGWFDSVFDGGSSSDGGSTCSSCSSCSSCGGCGGA